MKKPNRYEQIIERIFLAHYTSGARDVPFERDEIVRVADELGVQLPKNVGDLVYSFRYRTALPEAVRTTAPEGEVWIIKGSGRAQYRFALIPDRPLAPSELLAETKIPDATPGVVAMYALSDEQALLAKVRYNRLVDIFTGVSCYSLQNHLRTTVSSIGQIETEEVYIGVDRRGAQYVFPVQAKGGRDRLSIVQIEQDVAMCADKFPALICRPIAAQFMKDDVIALFDFELTEEGVAVTSEKHYRLVPPDQMSRADLDLYRTRAG